MPEAFVSEIYEPVDADDAAQCARSFRNGIAFLVDLAYKGGAVDQVVAERDMGDVSSDFAANTEQRANVHSHNTSSSVSCDFSGVRNAG